MSNPFLWEAEPFFLRTVKLNKKIAPLIERDDIYFLTKKEIHHFHRVTVNVGRWKIAIRTKSYHYD